MLALQLDKIIALLGPSCRLLDINICISYPVETNEARQARLDALRLAQQQRREDETTQERHARLDAFRLAQQQRRQNETPDERQARLEAARLTQQARRDISIANPLFQQNAVESRMSNFHSKLASLEFRECNTCSERFPNLTMSRNNTECSRCHQDRRIPKLFSTANNMNPGPVPQQLLVSSCVRFSVCKRKHN